MIAAFAVVEASGEGLLHGAKVAPSISRAVVGLVGCRGREGVSTFDLSTST
jgi:hypothetical protein